MGPDRCARARRRREFRGELISAPRAEISADQLDLCWGRGYKPLSAPTASTGHCPVTIWALARERSERVPDRSPGETVMADGDRVLALKNRRAGCLSRLMFGRYAGCAVSAALEYIATTIGTSRPSNSLSRPRASVSLMPAAHWFTVLNVAGATSTAFAGGSSSVSCGRRGLVRTAWPVTSARLPRSSHDAAAWVGMAYSSHPSSWSCRAASCQSWTGGAAHMIQYRTRGASVLAVMRQLARRSQRAFAGPEWQI